MSEYVCSNCGSGRISAPQRGIDNWLVAQCYDCGPRTPALPDEDGSEKTRRKRQKMLNTTMAKRKSQRAFHAVLHPVVLRADYKPKVKPKVAPTVGLFD